MTKEGSGRDRRRWPGAPLRGKVVGQIYTEHAAPIVDLSEGGALLEVPCALRPRSVYSVRLVLGPGTVLMLKASVVRSYVHRVESAGEGETQIFVFVVFDGHPPPPMLLERYDVPSLNLRFTKAGCPYPCGPHA